MSPFKPCDIYSFKASPDEIHGEIERELGKHFRTQGPIWNTAYNWSGYDAGNGLEIMLYSKRTWINSDGVTEDEASNSWVTIMLYYGHPTFAEKPTSDLWPLA